MKTRQKSAVWAWALAVFGLWASPGAGAAERGLEIYWVDSEGGGSTLIVTPAGESVLIDTGNPGGRDAGRIVAAAKAAGLTRIDHLIVTHFHVDHFGGAAEIAQQLPIGTIHDKGVPEGDPDGRTASAFPVQIKPYREIAATRARVWPKSSGMGEIWFRNAVAGKRLGVILRASRPGGEIRRAARAKRGGRRARQPRRGQRCA